MTTLPLFLSLYVRIPTRYKAINLRAAHHPPISAGTNADINDLIGEPDDSDLPSTQPLDVGAWFGETTPHQTALLDAILNITTAHLYITDSVGRHVYVSQSVADGLGRERAAMLGKTSDELGFPRKFAVRWEKERVRALDSGETVTGAIRYTTTAGVRDFEYTLRALPGADGQRQMVMTRARDVTERNRAEQARQESEARFRSMIETALDTISILEANGTIRYESPAITEILGYAPHEVEGRTAFEFVHPDDIAHVGERFGQILQEHGVVKTVEYRFRHKDGSWRMLESRGRNLLADPTVRGIVVNSRDVTEAREAERVLRQHQNSIEALNKRLQQGMKETHHRVKNNLQIIAAMVDMQAMEATDSIPVEEFRRLGTQIRTLAFVHDVLTKEVREEEQAQRISTRDVLTRLLPMFRQMAIPRRVSFAAEAAGVTARQGTSLALVLNEIFLNALKHGKGEVQIEFCVGEGMGRLDVRDEGPGYAPGFDASTSANTGLELILSLTQTDLGGVVTFANRPQGGAQVTVAFPLPDAVQAF